MPRPLPIQDILSRAERTRTVGRPEAAERARKTMLVLVPTHAGSLFQGAATAFSNDRIRTAVLGFRKVGCVIPAASAVHYNLGVCARRLDDHAAAERFHRRALVLEPSTSGAMSSRAQSLVALNRCSDAMRAAKLLCWLRPTNAETLATLGYVAWRAGHGTTALKALRQSMILEPGARGPEENFANTLVAVGRQSEAVHRYRRLSRIHPLDLSIWGNLGVALIGSGDWRGAAEAYRTYARLSRGRPRNQIVNDPLPALPVDPAVPVSRRTAWHRLKFDLEQLRYLSRGSVLTEDHSAEIEAYNQLLGGLDDQRKEAVSFILSDTEYQSISRVHGRLIHLRQTEWAGAATLNQTLKWTDIEQAYQGAVPAISVIDDFLEPAALNALRQFCLESTIWFQLKGAGYLGAYFREGFNDPLLLAIADELTEKMPTVFADQPLRMMWAYNYEQSMVGINPHADFAGVNVNFWITPNSANLEPETGGLLVYRRPAPEHWNFEQYNAAPGSEIMEYLGEDAKRPIRVAHRQNRAVIFDSRLFHETDRLNFRPGFENRRINVTMLFGGP